MRTVVCYRKRYPTLSQKRERMGNSGPASGDHDRARIIVAIEAVTAPSPVCGIIDEATPDRIEMDVPELLNEMSMGEDIMVVVAGLPNILL